MSALFAIGLGPALRKLQHELRPDEKVSAFLDDVYVSAKPASSTGLLARLHHQKIVPCSCGDMGPPGQRERGTGESG